jgi:hypothetical protein
VQDNGAVHQFPSFTQYLNKVFRLRDSVSRLSDARHDPDIPPQAVFKALLYGFVFRIPSFQQLQAEVQDEHFRRWIGAPRSFKDDVFRYSLCGFDLAALEEMLTAINRQLKRNKAFDQGRCQGHIVAALDGIEVLSSYSRCCDHCLERRITSKDRDGNQVEQIQYYHRAVGCQIVSSPVKPLLAVEWLRPGEGEDTAALRLLARLPDLYGSRFFDILLMDSLYAQSPVLKLAAQSGWGLIITFKQERRDLYQDAMGLFGQRPPNVCFSEKRNGGDYEVRIWEARDLAFTKDYPQPVRVILSKENVTQNHRRGKRLVAETTAHQWLWISTLDANVFPTAQVRALGHDRWKLENNGWNDLTQNWALKHGFLHACKHRPKQETEDGARELIPNQGLAAVTLILVIAFVLASAFALMHSKLYRLHAMSLLEVARQLYRSALRTLPPIRAPDS